MELVELVELGVEVEGRVAEGSRDVEEGSGARVRRSRSRDPACGTERPPFPSPHPEHQQFPPIRAEIAPENPSVPQPNRGADQHVPARSTPEGALRPRQGHGVRRVTLTLRRARHRATRARVRPLRSRGPGRSPRSHVHLVHGPVCSLAYEGGFSFLYFCVHAVAPCP